MFMAANLNTMMILHNLLKLKVKEAMSILWGLKWEVSLFDNGYIESDDLYTLVR